MDYLKLLSEIALSFQYLDDFNKEINIILEDIGTYMDLSKVYIFVNEADEILSNKFEWSPEGITSQKKQFQKIINKDMPFFHKMLKINGYICSNDISSFPQDMIDTLNDQQIKSLAIYPLLIKNKIIGFIGFEESRYKREWKIEELDIFHTISELVSNAFQRNFEEEEVSESRTNFRIFFETTDSMFMITDLDGNIIHANQSLKDKLGYSTSELINTNIRNLYPDDQRLKIDDLAEKLLDNQLDVGCLKIKNKFGEIFLIDSKIWMETWNGKPYIYAIAKDITESVKLRRDLEENYKKLTQIIDATRAGTWELDIQTGALHCNDYWTELLGYSLTEMQPINMDRWNELTHPEDLVTAYKELNKHISGETEYYECEMRMRHKNGHWIWSQARGKITELDVNGYPLKMFGTHSDISPRKHAEKRLKESEKRFFLALDKTEAGLWDIDLINNTIFLSPLWKNMLGYSDNDIENTMPILEELIHPDDLDEIKIVGEKFITGKCAEYESVTRFKHKNGSWHWILIRGGVLSNKDGVPARLIGTNIDITKEYEQALELESFFSVNLDLLCIISLEGEFIKTNKAWEEILGYSSGELKGKNFLRFVHPDDIQMTLKAVRNFNNKNQVIQFINRYRSLDGSYRYIEWRSNLYANKIYAAARDVTNRKKYEDKILELSNKDSLTNIYNRRYIFSRAEEILEEYIRTDKIFSICLIDIDDFKQINDRYGHLTGDYILKEFTKVIKEQLRPYDLFGRYGGEEFIIILNGIDAEKSKIVIERVLQTIRNKTFNYNKNSIKLTFSAGISTVTEISIYKSVANREIIEALVNLADKRMYLAKTMGKNSCYHQCDES